LQLVNSLADRGTEISGKRVRGVPDPAKIDRACVRAYTCPHRATARGETPPDRRLLGGGGKGDDERGVWSSEKRIPHAGPRKRGSRPAADDVLESIDRIPFFLT